MRPAEGHGGLEGRVLLGERANRPVEALHVRDEGDQGAQRDRPVDRAHAPEPENYPQGDSAEEHDRGFEDRVPEEDAHVRFARTHVAFVEARETAALAVEHLDDGDAGDEFVEVGVDPCQPEALIAEGAPLRDGEVAYEHDQRDQKRVHDQGEPPVEHQEDHDDP